MGGGDKLLDQIFNLKFTAKQMNKQASKSEKEERSEKLKVKKAMEKGNMEGAKIYAQNAIRKKNESLNYLKLASRLDAVVSRLETQAKMNMVNKNMAGIVKTLEKSLAAFTPEKMMGVMDQFEKQFENLDVQTEFVENAMSNQATLSTPEDQVSMLMQQVADEHNLEVSLEMPGAGTSVPSAQHAVHEDGDLGKRLADLRAK